MFYRDKKTIVDGLRKMRDQRCMYRGPKGQPATHCDCKYGIAKDGAEASGCPELAAAADILARMSDVEFCALTKRKIAKLSPIVKLKELSIAFNCPSCHVVTGLTADQAAEWIRKRFVMSKCQRCGYESKVMRQS